MFYAMLLLHASISLLNTHLARHMRRKYGLHLHRAGSSNTCLNICWQGPQPFLSVILLLSHLLETMVFTCCAAGAYPFMQCIISVNLVRSRRGRISRNNQHRISVITHRQYCSRHMAPRIAQQTGPIHTTRDNLCSPLHIIRNLDGTTDRGHAMTHLAVTLEHCMPPGQNTRARHMRFMYDEKISGMFILHTKGPRSPPYDKDNTWPSILWGVCLTIGTMTTWVPALCSRLCMTIYKYATKQWCTDQDMQDQTTFNTHSAWDPERTHGRLLLATAILPLSLAAVSYMMNHSANATIMTMSRLLIQLLLAIGGIEKNPGPARLSVGETIHGLSDQHAEHILYTIHTQLRKLRGPTWLNDTQLISLCYELRRQLPSPNPSPPPILSHQARAPGSIDDLTFKTYGSQYYPRCGVPFCDMSAPEHIAVKNITGDGACMYRAIMMALTGSQSGHLGLRLRVTLHLILFHRIHSRFSWVLAPESDRTDQWYCGMAQDTANPRGWSTHMNIMCAANVLRRSITILYPESMMHYEQDTATFHPLEAGPPTALLNDTPVILSWACYSQRATNMAEDAHPSRFNANHFVALIPSSPAARTQLPTARNAIEPHRQSRALQEYLEHEQLLLANTTIPSSQSAATNATTLLNLLTAPPNSSEAQPWQTQANVNPQYQPASQSGWHTIGKRQEIVKTINSSTLQAAGEVMRQHTKANPLSPIILLENPMAANAGSDKPAIPKQQDPPSLGTKAWCRVVTGLPHVDDVTTLEHTNATKDTHTTPPETPTPTSQESDLGTVGKKQKLNQVTDGPSLKGAEEVMRMYSQAYKATDDTEDVEMGTPWSDRINLEAAPPPLATYTHVLAPPESRPSVTTTLNQMARTSLPVEAWNRVVDGLPQGDEYMTHATPDTTGNKHPSATTAGIPIPRTTPEQHSRASPDPESAPVSDRLRIMTQNCRGVLANAVAVALTIEEHEPNIIFLTETKIVSNKNNPTEVKNMLQDYQYAISSTTRREGIRISMPRGSAGVIVAVHNTYAAGGRLVKQAPTPGLAGFVCHTAIRMENTKVLHLIGVYAPEDVTVRARIFNYLQEQCTLCASQDHALLVGGDWNAVLQVSDRNTSAMDTADRAFARFISNAGLQPLHTCGASMRAPTYTRVENGAITHTSRIDDVLTLQNLANQLASENAVTEHVPEVGGNLDHSTLIHDIRHLHLQLPATQTARETAAKRGPTLILPVSKSHLEASRLEIAASLGTAAARLRERLGVAEKDLIEQLGGDHTSANIGRVRQNLRGDTQSHVDLLALDIQHLTEGAMDVVMQVCATKPAGSGKIFLPRTASRRHRTLYRQHRGVKVLLRDSRRARNDKDLTRFQEQAMAEALKQTGDMATHKHLIDMPLNEDEPKRWEEWDIALAHEEAQRAQDFKAVTKQSRQISSWKNRKTFQVRLAKNPKAAHRDMFSPSDGEPGGPHSIRHPDTGMVHNTRQGVLQALHCFYTTLMTPPHGPKTGRYLPEDSSRDPPWARAGAIDRFDLTTPAVATRDTACMLDHIMDRELLEERLRHLARSKKGGPDGIPNEVLQLLPEDAIQALHSMFTIMWITGRMPTKWKQSVTVLLYKKGDVLNPANYRPICLANTLGKLWTSTVTAVLSRYAEEHSMLSSAQEGFRAHRNTSRQLSNLMHVIEDAALTGSNLYTLYVDFSSAFNMIDQDKLLITMYDLGYPTDSIEVVKGAYTDAITHIQASGGTSDAVQINRGTIQGDTLSPFLFLVFLEPLLRWLHSGGRDYRYGCLTDAANQQYKCSAPAYADDLAITTNTLPNLKVQVDKLEQYNNWSGLKANAGKCYLTGILYGDYLTGLTPSNNSPANTKHLRRQLEGTIKLGGEAIPFLPPDEPYRYLGVWLTMTLDFKHQLAASLKVAKDRGDALVASMASQRQCLHVINTCIKPALAYCFGLAPYTAADINSIDAVISRIAKACCRLPNYTPTAAVLLDKKHGGLGVTSMWVDYVQQNAACLTRSLNDTEMLGAVTHGLLHLQNMKAGDMMKDTMNKQGKFYSTLRQLAMCQKYGISIIQKKVKLDINDNEIWRQLIESSMLLSDDTSTQLKTRIMLPLSELGLSLHDLMENNGTHLIDTVELVARLGNRVQHRHRLALNRATLILTKKFEAGTRPSMYTSVKPLSAEQRLLPQDWTHSDARRSDSLPRSTGRLQPTPETTRLPSPTTTASRSTPMDIDNQEDRGDTPPIQDTQHTSDPANRTHEASHGVNNGSAERLCQAHMRAFLTANTGRKRKAGCSPVSRPATCVCRRHGISQVAHIIEEDLVHRSVERLEGTQARTHDPAPQTHSSTRYFVQREDTTHPTTCVADHVAAYLQHGLAILSVSLSPGNTHMTIVWKPSWVTEQEGEKEPGWAKLLKCFRKQRGKLAHDETAAPTTLHVPPRYDGHLTNLQQQGCWRNVPDYTVARDRIMRNMVHLRGTPSNPDVDIDPSKQHRVQIGLSHGERLYNEDRAYIYRPSGRCIGSIGIDSFKTLQWSHRREETRVQISQPGSAHRNFEEDLADLILRHDTRKPCPSHARHTMDWAASEQIMRCLSTLGVTQERFASPLQRSRHMPLFFSHDTEDTCFGSLGHAFSTTWQGASLVHLWKDHRLMDKAVRWAIASAEHTSVPTITIIIMPEETSSHYTVFLDHPLVHQMCTLVSPQVRTPDFWKQGDEGPGWKQAKCSYTVLAICNQQGTQSLQADPVKWARFHQEWEQATGLRPKQPEQKAQMMNRDDMQPKTPKALSEILQKNEGLIVRCPEIGWSVQLPSDGHGTGGPHRPLAMDPMTGVYTDGSCIREKGGEFNLGAAVWRMQDGAAQLWLVNPNGKGPTNTINRAELSALHLALTLPQIAKLDEDMTIYTDSLCSIMLIRKMIYSPSLLTESKHLEILQAIVSAITLRALAGARTSILKVKSHSGVAGNEHADKAASDMAKGHPASIPYTEPTTSTPYQTVAWPAKESEGDSHFFFENLTAAVKTHLRPELQSGQTKETLYVTLNREALRLTDPGISNHMWEDSSISHQSCIHTFKLRWGLIWNRKKAMMCKKVSDARCPLCTEEDGCSHIFGGCLHRTMKGHYIARHNKAVLLIHKAIQHGALGGSLCIVDATKDDELPEGVESNRVPDWLLPNVPRESGTRMRPDIMLIEGMPANSIQAYQALDDPLPTRGRKRTANGLRGQRTLSEKQTFRAKCLVHIIEVGYASNTRYHDKVMEKRIQHTLLIKALEDDGWSVHYHVVVLGTGGFVFTDTLTTLDTLMVPHAPKQTALLALHRLAVTKAHEILVCRRQLEHETPG